MSFVIDLYVSSTIANEFIVIDSETQLFSGCSSYFYFFFVFSPVGFVLFLSVFGVLFVVVVCFSV